MRTGPDAGQDTGMGTPASSPASRTASVPTPSVRENASRPSRSAGSRIRAALAGVLIVLSAILAPVAVVGAWARLELVDTDRFVATFAPLAQEPEVQALVAGEVTAAIERSVDIRGLVDEVAGGFDGLNLPPRATDALRLLAGPAAEGIRSLLAGAVDRAVASPAFATIWDAALRQSHARAIALLQDRPDQALALGDDGTLSLQLGPVIAQVRASLVDGGLAMASAIPNVERSIPLVTSDALVSARTGYAVATAAGYWLPWAVLLLAVAGVALARRRIRAVGLVGLGLTLGLLMLAAALGIGRQVLLGSVDGTGVPASTAAIVFDQVTGHLGAAIAALLVAAIALLVGGWVAGVSRPAGALRGLFGAGFAHVRSWSDRIGLDTGAFGRGLDRLRAPLVILVGAAAALSVFLLRPLTIGGVLGIIALALLVLVVLELLRRPETAQTVPADPA